MASRSAGSHRDQRALLRRHLLGFVFQGFNLLARTTALENVELPLIYRGMPAANGEQLRARGAGARRARGPRAPHARASCRAASSSASPSPAPSSPSPRVLLADEPTGNLDTRTSREIMELLTELNRDQGITIVMVTHEPDMAAYAAAHHAFPGRPHRERRAQPGGRLMLLETIKLALQAIRRNTLRSFLTVLGIVIGVGAVIAMVTIGHGTTAKVTADIAKLGSNLLFVSARASSAPGAPAPRPSPSTPATSRRSRSQIPASRRWRPVAQKR